MMDELTKLIMDQKRDMRMDKRYCKKIARQEDCLSNATTLQDELAMVYSRREGSDE